MIMYSPDPMSLVGWETPNSMLIPLASGGHVVAESEAGNRIRIVAVCSTDPMDFLDLRYQPGNVLSLDPGSGRLS